MKRIRIDRIDVDMRNVQPSAAREAAYRLGPAIRRAIADAPPPVQNERPGPGENPLAGQVARQIVGTTGLTKGRRS